MAYVPDEFLTRGTRPIDGVTALSKEPGRENIQVGHDPLMQQGPDNIADLVWTSLNYHDFHSLPDVDMVAANKILFRMLRPGGGLCRGRPFGTGGHRSRHQQAVAPHRSRHRAQGSRGGGLRL